MIDLTPTTPPWRYLDPGIASAVRVLWDAGYQTVDSGDGRSKPPAGRAFEFPHVFITTSPAGLMAAVDAIHGWPVDTWGALGRPLVTGGYDPRAGLALVSVMWPPEEPR